MKHYSFYDEFGAFVSRKWSGSEAQLFGNTPDGFTPIEGHFDHLSQRVDLSTGEVVDYQPPQPSDEHEWNADIKRWLLKPEVVERREGNAAIIAQIGVLEANQARPLRELRLDQDNVEAAQRLADIDTQIAALREQLK